MQKLVKKIDPKNWKQIIEITNLKSPPSKQLKKLTKKANEEGYCGICILPSDLRVVAKYRNPDLKIITVTGFPSKSLYELVKTNPAYSVLLGFYRNKELKELKELLKDPLIDELDIIFPFIWYFNNHKKRVNWFLNGIRKRFNKPLKVIIELGTLIKEEKQIKEICRILENNKVDYLKTNSGLLSRNMLDLMKGLDIVKKYNKIGLKVSGGIRKLDEVIGLIVQYNVDRIGTSSIEEAKK